uniref:non-specific serine/threonine protein kinase n=1 Tax=Aegilops tauschii subsp. strangulata TaxID=200361 RepID=A0A453Q799_AEGTS
GRSVDHMRSRALDGARLSHLQKSQSNSKSGHLSCNHVFAVGCQFPLKRVRTMGPAVLFLLVLAAVAPLLSAVKALDYHSMAKRSTIWINSDDFFDNRNYSRNILSIAQLQAHSDFELYVAAGFYCVSSMFPGDKFVFAVSIGDFTNTMVGIYNRQIVWFANRARPVRENATLEFTADGNLVLLDADGTHVWSSNISGRGVDGMKITETGNLLLFDQKNSTVWQSFDYPTDAILAGQSLVEVQHADSNSKDRKLSNKGYINERKP